MLKGKISGLTNASDTRRDIVPRGYFRTISLRSGSALALWFGTLMIAVYGCMEGVTATFAAYAAFGILGAALVWRLGSTSIRIYATVYGLAVAVAVVLAWIFLDAYGGPYFKGGSDELVYEEAGIEFAKHFGLFSYGAIRGGIVTEWHNSVGYIYLIGVLVKFSELFSGFHTMVPRLFNAASLALLSVLVFQIGIRLCLRRRTAVAAALFSGCLPLMMWTSAQTLRDIIQTLLIVALVFLWLPDHTNRGRYSVSTLLLMSSLLLVPIWEMRQQQAVVALILITFGIVSNGSIRPMHRMLLSLTIVAAVVYFAWQFYNLLNEYLVNVLFSVARYATLREGAGDGLSSVVFETPLFPVGWFYRAAYALASPIPVEFLPLKFPIDVAWLSLGTVFHILFLPFLWMGARRAASHPASRIVVLIFMMLFIGMAMFTFTIRHITQYLPFAIVLAALGYENYEGNPRVVLFIMVAFGAAMTLTYFILKGT
jgi:hypothetical protein